MDDHSFDDIIKGKVEGLEEPGFDPAALAAFHHQIASVAVVPWYARYQSAILVGSGMALCTFLIIWSQWYWTTQNSNLIENRLSSLVTERQEMSNKLDELQRTKSNLHDTIRIIEVRENTVLYTTLLNKIANLEYEIQQLRNSRQTSQVENQNAIAEGSVQDTDFAIPLYGEERSYFALSNRLTPRFHKRASERANADDLQLSSPAAKQSNKQLSAKTLRSIEGHYQRGVGIKVGPVFENSKAEYNVGSGQFNFGFGLLADFILSPSLSLETGAKYSRRAYSIDDREELTSTMPGVDESSGEFRSAEVDYGVLEIPINLKYRYPISLKTHWLAGIGYSPMVYLNELFEYDYAFDDGSGNNNFVIRSIYKSNKPTLYPGTLNFSIGLNHQLKNKKILEASLFYQHGLGEMGIERIKTNFFGLRGVYWFTLR